MQQRYEADIADRKLRQTVDERLAREQQRMQQEFQEQLQQLRQERQEQVKQLRQERQERFQQLQQERQEIVQQLQQEIQHGVFPCFTVEPLFVSGWGFRLGLFLVFLCVLPYLLSLQLSS